MPSSVLRSQGGIQSEGRLTHLAVTGANRYYTFQRNIAYTTCERCGKRIEQKWTQCYVCRQRPTKGAKQLPEPAMQRKSQDHHGRPTYSNL